MMIVWHFPAFLCPRIEILSRDADTTHITDLTISDTYHHQRARMPSHANTTQVSPQKWISSNTLKPPLSIIIHLDEDYRTNNSISVIFVGSEGGKCHGVVTTEIHNQDPIMALRDKSLLHNSGFTSPDQVVIPIILPFFQNTKMRPISILIFSNQCFVLGDVAVSDWLQLSKSCLVNPLAFSAFLLTFCNDLTNNLHENIESKHMRDHWPRL